MADGVDFDFFDSDPEDGDITAPASKQGNKSASSVHSSHSSHSRASSSNSKRLVLKAKIPTSSNHHSDSDSSTDTDSEVRKRRNADKYSRKNNNNNSPSYNSTHQKPPRPQSSKVRSGSSNQKAWQQTDNNNDMEASISQMAPGSTYYTSDGRKMKKGRCTYSDEELSHSSDEEVRISYNSDRSVTPRRDRSLTPRRQSRRSHSPPSSRSQSQSQSRSRSHSNSSQWSTGSEGDTRRRNSSRPHTRLSHRQHRSNSDSSISVSSLSDNEQPERQSRVIGERSGQRSALKSDSTVDKDQLNLKLLLSALLDADQESQSYHHYQKKHVSIHSPPQSAGHRSSGQRSSGGQRSRPSSAAVDNNRNKTNFTFSTDQARMIDMENQRLLNNILSQRASTSGDHQGPRIQQQRTTNTEPKKPKAKGRGQSQQQPTRMTPATLNRMREQQRIERENLAMLRRLNKVKPTAEMNRAKQLDDYHKQISYYCPEMRTGGDFNTSMDGQARRSKSSQGFTAAGGTGRRSRPVSAGTNRAVSAYTNTTGRPRPSSATNRPSSASNRPANTSNRPSSASYTHSRPSSATIRKKPEWQTGW